MKKEFKEMSLRWLQAVGLSALVTTPVWGDDSDIYTLRGGAYSNGTLRVMLTLDPRSSGGATECRFGGGGNDQDCYDYFGRPGDDSLLVQHVDMFNSQGQQFSDGYADIYQPVDAATWDPASYPFTGLAAGDSIADVYWPGSGAELIDLIRTVVRASLEKVAEIARTNSDKIGGLEVGLMVSHDDSCTTNKGPGKDTSKCSAGAYVLQGFTDILDDQKLGLQTLFQKIGALRFSGTEWPGKSNNFSGHPYQVRDIYLE